MNNDFYDIPIYRLSEKEYYHKRDSSISKNIEFCMQELDPTPEMITRNRNWREQHFYENYGPWRYNEIIGYIRLHFLGSQVRGEYLSAERKRNGLSRNRVFTYRTHKLAPEVNIWPQSSNEQIFGLILGYLDRCEKELKKGRFLDRDLFEKLGRHVDWRGFLEWSNNSNEQGDKR